MDIVTWCKRNHVPIKLICPNFAFSNFHLICKRLFSLEAWNVLCELGVKSYISVLCAMYLLMSHFFITDRCVPFN